MSEQAVAVESSSASRLFDVVGRGALVTGAASGLGLAVARVLACNGARVTLVDVEPDAVSAASDRLAAEGGSVRARVADIGQRDAVDDVMREASRWESGLDIVFANAGISAGQGRLFGVGTLDAIDDDRWEGVLQTNLTGTKNTVRGAAEVMNRGTGRIVVVASVAGLSADPLVGYAYSSSKAAVTLFAQNAAAELAPEGINVNVIAPGSFQTAIGARNPDNGRMLAALTAATATGHLADPAELEGLALLLASPAARHIVGSVFVIDGGVAVFRSDSRLGQGAAREG